MALRPGMSTVFVICLYLALTAIAIFIWRWTIAAIRRRAQKIDAVEIKDFVRLHEDPWCQAYISIGMILNNGLLVLAYVIKQAMLI
jgi:hypothetical protein